MHRLLAKIDSGRPGPLVLVVVALHGNEHVGINAVRRFQDAFDRDSMAGRLVAVVGNLEAANHKQRYIDRDLNRFFQTDLLENDSITCHERFEALELIAAIDAEVAGYPEATEVHLFDMHSMSGHGVPFCCFPHTMRNEAIAHLMPVPAIADLVEILPGTLTEYYSRLFHSTMVVECGQHESAICMENGFNALISYLAIVGMLPQDDVSREAHHHLQNQTHGQSSIFTRVNYRYHIVNQGYFEMQPGFHNLQSVARDQLLAIDRACKVHSPYAGRVVLPCYQKQGDDGFFIAVDE